MKNDGIFSNLKQDIPASIVVFLVAVPLCLGIALASGAPMFSGIIAGIVGGIVVGAISGSQLGVSGPAAGLAVIVLSAIQELGAFDIFLMAVVIGGVIQLILGILRAGVIGYYFPSSVIKGMLAGIGIIIFYKQLPIVFGYKKMPELAEMANGISTGAVIITLVSIAILILWEQKFMKKIRIFQIVQGPLVVVATGIILALVFQSMGNLALAPNQMVDIPVAESIGDFFGLFSLPNFNAITNPQVWITGIVIAVVASLETLLCLEATDKLDPYKRVSPANQELVAQGIGNMVSGMIGGLPITQVIVRSSTNIQSGGRTKMAAILHGVILLVCAMMVPTLLKMIPLASLAAILFLVGYKLAKPVLFKQMFALGQRQFVPFILTIAGIVFIDLLWGIGIGVVVSILYLLYNNYKKPFLFETDKHISNGAIRLELAEDVTFINKANIQRALSRIPDGSKVIIDASKSINIDHDVVEIIEEFKTNAEFRDIELELIEFNSVIIANQMKEVEHAINQNMINKNGSVKTVSI